MLEYSSPLDSVDKYCEKYWTPGGGGYLEGGSRDLELPFRQMRSIFQIEFFKKKRCSIFNVTICVRLKAHYRLQVDESAIHEECDSVLPPHGR